MSRHFHFTPFRQFHKSGPDAIPSRIYDKIYSSEAMIEAYEKLQTQPNEPNCTLEKVVLSLMWWSDSTHLASFGNASLWPLYLFFGNLSKWIRGKPRSGACHHVAYIPKARIFGSSLHCLLTRSVQLPDSFHDFFTNLTGEGPSADVLAHCRRELMHAVWAKIFDGDFMNAYEHGIVLECHGGVLHRFYPRIFTYSADYPEKVLLACIRNMGKCPCPRCTISKNKIDGLGIKNDDKNRVKLERVDNQNYKTKIASAQRFIHEHGLGVKSKLVEALLDPTSLVPTKNTFSERFSRFGFNFYKMLVPDLLHEFELGVFKSLFSHLIRILIAHGGSAIQTLNARYRLVPTFGQAVIRRFDTNASAMKKMAARNFEDLLQCAIPVIESLLPDGPNRTVLDLLFTCAEWHALGKLRMHATPFIKRLSDTTTFLGRQLRHFVLPREEAARGRRNARKKKTKPTPTRQKRTPAVEKKKVLMSLLTYKLHSLGDYVRKILWLGTIDSYSTQTGELEHRRVKRFYARTNKNTAVRQMTFLERREQALLKIARAVGKANATAATPATPTETAASASAPKPKKKKTVTKKKRAYIDFAESESLPYTAPEEHHHISHSLNFPVSITEFLRENEGDPAIEDFLPKLKDHLLGHLIHPELSSEGSGYEFTPGQHFRLLIKNDRFYRHKVLRVYYTTYNVRRGQDSMNLRTRANILTLAPEGSAHPFAYARITGVFHVNVVHNVPGASQFPTLMEVLWVRNFRIDTSFRAGFKAKRLHRLQFLPVDDPNVFSFLNPDETTCWVGLRSQGRENKDYDDDKEWRYHYINIFVDRDMYVRYIGGGVGHYQVEITEEEDPPAEDRPDDLSEDSEEDVPEPPTHLPEEEIPDKPRMPDADGVDGVAIPSSGADAASDAEGSDDGEEDRDSTVESDEGSAADADGEDAELDESGSEDDDLGAEDGEGFMDPEDEEGYAPL
ncbi:hypothetical protein MVEN_01712600 [Mycena venus]|uniref:Uncharacterized protein n=1 Tax=Mycena venus TaxID=2733690 RepID=A0A8H6XP76_9AGAR|nr:hypothetical protein MVEN_01712600 [Mycena venus]